MEEQANDCDVVNGTKEAEETNEPVKRHSIHDSGDLAEILSNSESTFEGRKQVFILSSAGKPVYSRCGNEDKYVTLFGVMQALVSVVQDNDDTLEAINCGKSVIVFLTKGPIILVGVNYTGESIDYLEKQLLYVYNQVVSILTLTQMTAIFEKRHNYDLRRLLTGSERLIDHLITFTETNLSFVLDSVSCVPMPHCVRDAISNTIISICSKIKNLVFAILLGNNDIITIIRMKKYCIEPCDIHLICNLVSSSESFKTAESWTPVCLPNFNPSGFLQAHVSYLYEDCSACLLLFTVERDSFFTLSEARNEISKKLTMNQCSIKLKESLSKPPLTIDKVPVPFVRHFIYKCKQKLQNFIISFPKPYDNVVHFNDIFRKYELLISKTRNKVYPLEVMCEQLKNEIMFARVTTNFEIYAVLEPMITKIQCIETTNRLIEWIDREKDHLFMLNYYTFS